MISRILVVDGDASLLDACGQYLSGKGYDVLPAASGEEALTLLRRSEVDVILLDVDLPDGLGFDLVSRIRQVSRGEIVFITGRDAPGDRVTGLSIGAEYITKPFEMKELSLRLSMLEARVASRIVLPPLEIDCVARRAMLNSVLLELTESEFRLLERLARAPGVPVPFDALSVRIWPGDRAGADRMMNIMRHASALRRKLDVAEKRVQIVSRRGVGYELVIYGAEEP
jgi:Response regulators consisting of a CheY-like receiver domain and a winged-helix DNA-binding domain